MAIIIKELVIEGKVTRDLPDLRLPEEALEDYLRQREAEIIKRCVEAMKEELEKITQP